MQEPSRTEKLRISLLGMARSFAEKWSGSKEKMVPSEAFATYRPVIGGYETDGSPAISGWRTILDPRLLKRLSVSSAPLDFQLDQYASLAEQLASFPKMSTERSKQLLNELARKAAFVGIDKGVDEDALKILVEMFLEHIGGHACPYSVPVLLKGVSLLSERITVSTIASLRRVKAEDLEMVFLPYAPSLENQGELQGASSVLDVTMRSNGGRDVQRMVDRTISILRLYQVGAVDFIRYNLGHECFESIGGMLSHFIPTTGDPRYSIGVHEEQSLQKFYEAVGKHWYIAESPGMAEDSLSVAFYQYSDSLLRYVSEEWKLSTAVMGLEALFLTESAEASFRLRVRVSKLMGLSGLNPDAALESMRKAYALRSQFVHGRLFSAKQRVTLKPLLADLQEYLRRSILFYLLNDLRSYESKRALVKLIDSTLTDSSRDRRLQEAIPENLRNS